MQGTGDRAWARLDGRGNALNAVRLFLAGTVVVGHSWEIGYGVKPPVPDMASYAVDGFFVISGFLITASRSRLAAGPFLWRRALRIFPGLWASLLVTAFVFAPLTSDSTYSFADAASYVGSNALLQMGQPGIGAMLHGLPVPGQWNGSLWTLTFEFACYLGACALFAVTRRPAPICAAVLGSCVTLSLMWPASMNVFTVQQSVRLVGFFAAGALLYLVRDRVRLTAPLAAASMAVVALAAAGGHYATFWAVAPLPLGYALLWAGANLPTRLGATNDASFGMYIYAFPVQQMLAMGGLPSVMTAPAFALLSLAAVAPLAVASWLAVERPAMRLRSQRYFVTSTRHRGLSSALGHKVMAASQDTCSAMTLPPDSRIGSVVMTPVDRFAPSTSGITPGMAPDMTGKVPSTGA